MGHYTRRRFLGAASAGAVALAGCSAEEGPAADTATPLSGGDYPAVDEWLTETEVGGESENYDGTLVDARDQGNVTVDTGAEGNGGNYAFEPVAMVVSTGTTVEWNWTGEGDAHNVVADGEQGIGETDFEFNSGDPVDTEGVEFSETFDETGTALYQCVPHIGLGMKGAVVVE